MDNIYPSVIACQSRKRPTGFFVFCLLLCRNAIFPCGSTISYLIVLSPIAVEQFRTFLCYLQTRQNSFVLFCAISKRGRTVSYFSVLSPKAVEQFRTFLCYLQTRQNNLVLFCAISKRDRTISYFSVLSPKAVEQFRTFLCYLKTRQNNLVPYCAISELFAKIFIERCQKQLKVIKGRFMRLFFAHSIWK